MIVYSNSLNASQPESVNPLNRLLINSIIYLVVFPTAVLMTSLWHQSIPPTSVEAERASSAAGTLCAKIRLRPSDATLDTLCFLRSYYRKWIRPTAPMEHVG